MTSDAPGVERIARCFGLDETERSALAILASAEQSLTVAQELVTSVGGTRLTVAVLRELLLRTGHSGLIERLAPTAALRRHALVHVVGADDRHVTSDDLIRVEVGLVPALSLGSEWSALRVSSPDPVRTSEPRPGFAQRAGVNAPQVLCLEGSAPRGLGPIADALADQLSRRVVWCNASDELDPGRAARLRRDADLDGAALVLRAPSAAVLRAVLVAPAAQAPIPPLVVVLDRVVEEWVVASPWVVRRDKVGLEQARGPSAAASPLDYIRELAQHDADRALGIVRAPMKARPVVPGQIVDAPVRVAAAPAEIPEPVAPPIVVTVAPSLEPVDASPRLAVPADARPDVLARLAMQSPSVAQRVELMNGLSGFRSPAVVAMLRHNVKSESPKVKQTAERLMTLLFGDAWNKTRAITPPLQPPPPEE